MACFTSKRIQQHHQDIVLGISCNRSPREAEAGDCHELKSALQFQPTSHPHPYPLSQRDLFLLDFGFLSIIADPFTSVSSARCKECHLACDASPRVLLSNFKPYLLRTTLRQQPQVLCSPPHPRVRKPPDVGSFHQPAFTSCQMTFRLAQAV